MPKGFDLVPEGTDKDGWTNFRTSLGDLVGYRANPDGTHQIRFPADKYELKEFYNVESTGECVIDLVPKKGKEEKK